MDVEALHVKRARKAECKADKAAAADAAMSAARERARKMEGEFLQVIARARAGPPTSEELRQREEENHKYLSETWERLRDNWFYVYAPFESVRLIPKTDRSYPGCRYQQRSFTYRGCAQNEGYY